MKKTKIIIGLIICVSITSLLVALIICLCSFGRETSVPEISEYAINYEFKNNNLLGLSKISIDENKYVYEFSSKNYLNRSRISEFVNSQSEKKAIGLFRENESGEIKEKTLSDVEIIKSGGKTYIIVRPDSENGKYIGFYLFFNDFREKIEVLYDQEPIVAVGKYKYEKNQFKRKSQRYNLNKWERKTVTQNSINGYK